MFSEYKKQVIKLYEEKRDAMLLPLNLQNPTPARLKDECLAVIAQRFKKSDEKILRDFFGDCGDVEEAVSKRQSFFFKKLFLLSQVFRVNKSSIYLL
jgi:hypothetical protein